MAKLSAYGRTEVARFQKVERLEDGRTITTTQAFMSDRSVLTKQKVTVVGGRAYDWGWTKAGHYDTVEARAAVLESKGYVRVAVRS